MRLILWLSCSLFIMSCSNQKTKNIEWQQVISFNPQAFDVGSNTLQMELPLHARQYLANEGMDSNALRSITLTQAMVMVDDSTNMDDLETMLLQFTSTNAKMKQLAIGENTAAGTTSLPLNIAAENEVTAYFKDPVVIAVMEVNAAEGTPAVRQLRAQLTFNITIKE